MDGLTPTSGAPAEGCPQRFFVSYTGVKLPFRLVNELDPQETENRNTFLRADYDSEGRLTGFDKLVYGEISLSHRYDYWPSGVLRQAVITNHDEGSETTLSFDENGGRV